METAPQLNKLSVDGLVKPRIKLQPLVYKAGGFIHYAMAPRIRAIVMYLMEIDLLCCNIITFLLKLDKFIL